ncbi:MAG: tRNA preQ1(34) S-adenosylmethionine ribosyltransferase-isomerase QueA [Wenzhouxiangellaceae bacterium]|nr:tRNA preQ1(34) S-adenosylmethionine ribosyltransferase-isomerase QueA [Wenzhouxiangellaceae bacterium]
MKVSEFHFDLPEHLIAQQPLSRRSASRLLVMDRRAGSLDDCKIDELDQLLDPGDLLVFNNTRVIPARMFAAKATGGRVEILVERVLDGGRALAQIGANRKPVAGSVLYEIETGAEIVVEDRQDEFWRLRLQDRASDWLELLGRVGHMPLPPYIQRQDQAIDRERYQTLYAAVPGAVAAPTAGLHFDQPLLDRLDARGIKRGFCTLHVGAGTFQPVRVDEVEQHRMHPEWLRVDEALVEQVKATRAAGKRVLAVGTTAVRALETAAAGGEIQPFSGESRIFIYPGYRFAVVDAMVTNFHLPGSTLVMLVSAFASREHILAAYRHAIEREYRFFSYGDAMLIR